MNDVTIDISNIENYTIELTEQGPQGFAGPPGADGPPGEQGEPGANGVGIRSIEKTSTSGLVDTYTITYTDDVTQTYTITNGKDAEVNGYNTVTIYATDGISLTQDDDELTISGASIVSDITNIEGDIDDIEALIPAQASSLNQLADKSFVNSTVQTGTANFRGNWDDWADVPTDSNDYPVDYAGSKVPTVNDYLVVQDASDYSLDTLEGTWRFKYSGVWATDGKPGWLPEYQVNESPLTSAQLAALNSGATTTNIGQITTNQNAIGNLTSLTTTDKTNLVSALNELNSTKQNTISATNKISADNVDDTSTINKFVTASDITTWNNKQDLLVSGTNIKTINNTSILGSGDITISPGDTLPSQAGHSGEFLTTDGTDPSWAIATKVTIRRWS